MPAPSLRELQESFWQALAHDPGAPEGPAPEPGLLAVVAPAARLAPADRVRIYADMYFWRILDALRADFPRLAAVLGEERFQALGRAYLARHPSRHPSLRHAGGALPAFLAAEGLPDLPYLADLARLEWARVEVFDALDAHPVRVEDLRRLPADEWPALRFAPVPALAVLVADWPVDRVWDLAASGEVPAVSGPARTALRVWREGFAVYHVRMDAREEEALGRVLAGCTFATVCDGLDDPAEAGALLLRWLEDGILRAAAA
jgi:hypothetical protein